MPGQRALLTSIVVGLLVVGASMVAPISAQSGSSKLGTIWKNGFELDITAFVTGIGDEFDLFDPTPLLPVLLAPPSALQSKNVQVNDGGLDNIQIFPGFRPFVKFTQSETSIAAYGRNLVAAYNTSANQPLVQLPSGGLAFVRRFLSGFSVSNDGGKTWTSGFLPPLPGSVFTFGDPVVDVDRKGNFYFAGLGATATGLFTIQVNKSVDGGRTWSPAILVQQDNGGDKEWLAVGPDPANRNRDNVYVTWTSFQPTGAQLRLGRSFDGGMTWQTKIVLAPPPNPDPTFPQNFIQFTNTYVDRSTGRLYIPFLHFSNADEDFIRILISDDAGDTFSFATFNIPGAPDPTLLPVVSAGELIDCGTGGGLRLTIHSGPDIGGGRFGLRRFVNAARLVTQPAFVARNGVLYLAWSASTSPIFGDPTAQSNVLFIRSDDGGMTWTSQVQVNPPVATNVQHVLPALDISREDHENDLDGDDADDGDDDEPADVHVAYYVQHADGTIDVDLATSRNGGASFRKKDLVGVTNTSSALAPTNIPLAGFVTTNYDRLIVPCYNLGEYIGVKAHRGKVHVLWGDGRNTVTEPVNPLNPISGQTHPQQDVFHRAVRVDGDDD